MGGKGEPADWLAGLANGLRGDGTARACRCGVAPPAKGR